MRKNKVWSTIGDIIVQNTRIGETHLFRAFHAELEWRGAYALKLKCITK